MLTRRLIGGAVRARGATLLELVIAIALAMFLVLLGLPSFSAYLQNSKLRSTAESFLAGLQRARAEGMQRNSYSDTTRAHIEFVLTDDDVGGINVNTAALSNTGRSWMVRWGDSSGLFSRLDSKIGAEGAGTTSAPAVQVAGTDANGTQVLGVIFDGYGAPHGMVSSGSAALPIGFLFTNPTGGACAPGGPMRCLKITISIGGRIRLCDPAVNPVTSPTDSRAC